MSIQLQEIKNIYIKNRLTEGVDFKRYEWLNGDGRAYIDTKVTDLSTSDYIKTIFDDSYNVGFRSKTWGREGSRLIVGNENLSTSLTVWGTSSSFLYTNSGIYMYDMYFDLLNNKVTINNETHNLVLPHGDGVSLLLFARHNNSVVDYINWAKFKSFEIHNQINLVPCQLLKSIPASLDANNKARAAGECGMYDSISGKFYGNVASTGTFTVEGDVEPETHSGLQQIYQNKLIEDIDYETYDWLKVNTTNAHGQILMQLPINSKNFEFKRNWIQVQNSEYFNVKYNYFYFIIDFPNNVNNRKVCVYSNIIQGDEYVDNYVQSLGIIHEVKCTDETCSINNRVIPWYGDSLNITMRFYNTGAYDKDAIFLTSPIVVDGEVRYVPCRLLHNIPLNLDAQCKSRQTGECGFVDLKSGKFYGNVANGGTFTVVNEYDGWLKNCSILFDPLTAAVYTNYYPPHYEFYGRVEVAKLTPEFVDFGFIQMSNTQVKAGDNVFNADFGANKWATFIVKHWDGNRLYVEVNGVDLGSPPYPTIYSWAPHIYLYDIMQINKIEMWVYPRQEEPTYSYHDSFIPRQDIYRDDNKQYLTNDSDRTFRIDAD